MAGLLDYLVQNNNGLLGSPFDPQTYAPSVGGDASGFGVLGNILRQFLPSASSLPSSAIGPMSPEGVVHPNDLQLPMQSPPPPPAMAGNVPGGAAPALPPPVNVASLPMPQSVEPSQAAIPPTARPAMAQGQNQPPAPATPPPSILDRLGSGIGNNYGTLLGMGGALMSGRGFGGALTAAQGGLQQDMQRNMQIAALSDLYKRTGGNLGLSMALLSKPELYGSAVKAGDVSLPAFMTGGVGGASGGASMGDMINTSVKLKQAGAAAQKMGETQGTAAAALPMTLDTLDKMVGDLNEVKNAPNLADVIGPLAGRLPGIGGKQADLINRIDQLKGEQMLQGIKQLQGMGRITQTEALIAGGAVGRLQRVGSVEGFKTALNDLNGVLSAARTRAGTMAGGEPTPPPAQATQAGGGIPSGWSVQVH